MKTVFYAVALLFGLLMASDMGNGDIKAQEAAAADKKTTEAPSPDSMMTDSSSLVTMRTDSTSVSKIPEQSELTPNEPGYSELLLDAGYTDPPELEIEPSRFVEFLNSSIDVTDGGIVFKGDFIVLGKAIYGHFECSVIGTSNTVLASAITGDRAYRSDKGGKVKTIRQNVAAVPGARVILVTFHETRVEE